MHRILAFLLFALNFATQAGESLNLTPAQARALGIESSLIAPQEGLRPAGLPARVLVPNAQMRVVAAPVAGMVEQLLVAPGTPVRRGQVVARLQSPQALELQRDAQQAASQSMLLQQNLKRDEALFGEGLIAEARLQATRAAAAQAATLAEERRQGLALAGAATGKLGASLALTAPIDGVVLEQGVQLGQRVDSAALIYRIARLTPLWLEIQMPLDRASGLRTGMPVQVIGTAASGQLIAIGRAVDPASQTILLRAQVSQGADRLTPGQVVEIQLDNAGAGIRIPAGAVVRHAGKQLAFVQESANEQTLQFAARPLRMLDQGGDTVSVAGLQPGDRLVTRGASALKAILSGVGKE